MADDTTITNEFRRDFVNAVLAIDMSSPSPSKNKPLEAYLARTLGWDSMIVKSVANTNATDNRLSEALRKRPAPSDGLLVTKAAIRHSVVEAAKKFVGHSQGYRVILVATQDGDAAALTDVIHAAPERVPQIITQAFPNVAIHPVATNEDLFQDRPDETIRPGLIRILSEYPTAVRQPLKDHPLATFIRKGWPAQVYELLEHAKLASNIQCGGTKFIGNWASVPWIGIRHDTLAPSFMAGTYCVYLFSEDGANAVLSLGQGVVKDEPGISAENLEALFREVPPPKGFTVGRLDPAVLASTGGSLAKQYANATLLHRVYARNSMPDEEHLSEALFAIVRYLHTLASSPKAIQLLRPGFMFVKDEPPVAPRGSTVQPTYNIDQCIEDTGFAKEDLQSWMAKLRRKKHLAIQGPPGTGKTFLARHLARLVVSDTNGLIETIQFHPSYSYEDFVQGFRPEVLDGQLVYDLRPGRFLDFCMEAQRVAPSPAVLIIDEMNRGNLSRIFGELLYLLEYRDQSVPLSQGKELFSVPSNVLLIGTMNTADRSIALVDHALRRRFSFVFLGPDYELLARRLKQWGLNPKDLVETLERINRTIGDRNYHIGTSFFLTPRRAIKAQLSEIWEGEIEPYLDEYFFDQLSKVEPFRWKNVGPKILAGWAEPEPDDQHARVDS